MLEDLGILTPEVRARREAQQTLLLDDTAEPDGNGAKDGNGNGSHAGNGSPGESKPPTAALTDTPPVIPAQMQGRDLGPACEQCGGMMQRTGTCYTCMSCGNNTGCG
jgi:ribonucleoside-diphosphate reductase alpha chain